MPVKNTTPKGYQRQGEGFLDSVALWGRLQIEAGRKARLWFAGKDVPDLRWAHLIGHDADEGRPKQRQDKPRGVGK